MSSLDKFVIMLKEHKKSIAKAVLCFMGACYILFASWVTSDSLIQMLAVMIVLVILISIAALVVVLIRIISED